MLERITIRNFKSFPIETTIDFTKTNYTNLPNNCSDDGIVKGAVFVGPNASGKSNVIESIKLLLDMLFLDSDVNSDFYKCLFNEDTTYSLNYLFSILGSEVEYEFVVDIHKKIIKELLLVDNKKMIDRIGNSANVYVTNATGSFYSDDDINENTLFLRTLYFNTRFTSNSVLKEWMEYLSNSVYINVFEKIAMPYKNRDLNIVNYLSKNGSENINKFFDDYNFKINVEYSHESVGGNIKIVSGDNENEKNIFFKRKDVKVPIPFLLESMGNQNLLNMLPSFLYVVQNDGLLLIDEFSSGFHNELEELLIKYFMNNSKRSQMFFVSHSTNILKNTILRPDQEYSVEFNGINGSIIKRFSSEQPRLAQNIEKMYVSGVFGGLPNYLKDKDED